MQSSLESQGRVACVHEVERGTAAAKAKAVRKNNSRIGFLEMVVCLRPMPAQVHSPFCLPSLSWSRPWEGAGWAGPARACRPRPFLGLDAIALSQGEGHLSRVLSQARAQPL